jgi:2-keto-4-pentenoate hydratase/2-oxohepta-3-ene-1,7-dioic acid hydratase in catechol pathway
LSGPYDDIDPGVTQQLDYQVELGVAIGQTARYVPRKMRRSMFSAISSPTA